MKPKKDVDHVIAEIVEATSNKHMSAREKYLYRETLRSLVRLARSELLAEMRSSVSRLTGLVPHSSRRSRLLSPYERRPSQQRFEFNPME
ncbi:MAG: hypothetical protein JWP36_85 [Paucimonas sp.]|nr:hypothetical protein [Paucimonas sp.]